MLAAVYRSSEVPMISWRFLPCLFGLTALPGTLLAGGPESPATVIGTTYRVQHCLKVKNLPAESKSVRIWFWVPDDDEAQKVLNLVVDKAPEGYRLTRDAANGHRYLFAEASNPDPTV